MDITFRHQVLEATYIVYPRLRPPNKKMLLGYSILQTKPGDEDA